MTLRLFENIVGGAKAIVVAAAMTIFFLVLFVVASFAPSGFRVPITSTLFVAYLVWQTIAFAKGKTRWGVVKATVETILILCLSVGVGLRILTSLGVIPMIGVGEIPTIPPPPGIGGW